MSCLCLRQSTEGVGIVSSTLQYQHVAFKKRSSVHRRSYIWLDGSTVQLYMYPVSAPFVDPEICEFLSTH